jgi:5'-nucleotidase
LHGLRSVALSQYYRGGSGRSLEAFEAAAHHGASVIRKLLDEAPWEREGYGLFYSLNFPAVPAAEVKGVRATYQGARSGPTFGVQPQTSPNGRQYLWLTHGTGNNGMAAGSDAHDCHTGHVTVTPLSADLTVHEMVKPLAAILR